VIPIETLHKVDVKISQEGTYRIQRQDLQRKPERMYEDIHAKDSVTREEVLRKAQHQLLR